MTTGATFAQSERSLSRPSPICVDRITEASDRRSVRITPTQKARKLLLKGRARRVQVLAKRLDGLTYEELKVLQKAAQIIARL
jgi:DNA-binding MarR family transcriptional regulator